MTPTQIKTMLKLQDRINNAVNPHWRGAGYDWPLAIMIECAELIDHIGWKWWKRQEPNLPQAQIEVVDIWHFVLSRLMETYSTQSAVQLIGSYMNDEQATYITYPPIQAARDLSKVAAGGHISLPWFAHLCHSVGLTHDDLFRMYVGKAALNLFRQEHGYKGGTYIKDWHGKEDNVWLEGILVEDGLTDLDEILESLTVIYLTVTASAQKADA